jgi:hypothetical protein
MGSDDSDSDLEFLKESLSVGPDKKRSKEAKNTNAKGNNNGGQKTSVTKPVSKRLVDKTPEDKSVTAQFPRKTTDKSGKQSKRENKVNSGSSRQKQTKTDLGTDDGDSDLEFFRKGLPNRPDMKRSKEAKNTNANVNNNGGQKPLSKRLVDKTPKEKSATSKMDNAKTGTELQEKSTKGSNRSCITSYMTKINASGRVRTKPKEVPPRINTQSSIREYLKSSNASSSRLANETSVSKPREGEVQPNNAGSNDGEENQSLHSAEIEFQ